MRTQPTLGDGAPSSTLCLPTGLRALPGTLWILTLPQPVSSYVRATEWRKLPSSSVCPWRYVPGEGLTSKSRRLEFSGGWMTVCAAYQSLQKSSTNTTSGPEKTKSGKRSNLCIVYKFLHDGFFFHLCGWLSLLVLWLLPVSLTPHHTSIAGFLKIA